jgi:hypothetical protein
MRESIRVSSFIVSGLIDNRSHAIAFRNNAV